MRMVDYRHSWMIFIKIDLNAGLVLHGTCSDSLLLCLQEVAKPFGMTVLYLD